MGALAVPQASGVSGGTRGSAWQSSTQALPNCPGPHMASQLCQPSTRGPRRAQIPVPACTPCLQTCHTCMHTHTAVLCQVCAQAQVCCNIVCTCTPLRPGTPAGVSALVDEVAHPAHSLLFCSSHANGHTLPQAHMQHPVPPCNHHKGLWVPPAPWVPRLVAPASLVPCHQVPPSVTSPAALCNPKGWLGPGSPEGGWRCLAHPRGDVVALSPVSPLGHWYDPAQWPGAAQQRWPHRETILAPGCMDGPMASPIPSWHPMGCQTTRAHPPWLPCVRGV